MFGAGTTRNGVRASIRNVVSGLGYDPDAVISAAKINHSLYADHEFAVPTSMFCQLMAHCAAETSCQAFGMLVGTEGALSWLGRIGFVAQNSDNVADALKVIGNYFHLHDRSAVVELKPRGDLIALSYAPLVEMEGQDQWLSGVLSCAVRFMRELCGTGCPRRSISQCASLAIRDYMMIFFMRD